MKDPEMEEVRALHRFLRSRGWKQYFGMYLWYKPVPGAYRNLPLMGQRLYGSMHAFNEERLRVDGVPQPVTEEARIEAAIRRSRVTGEEARQRIHRKRASAPEVLGRPSPPSPSRPA
jgi:hypothetical protein